MKSLKSMVFHAISPGQHSRYERGIYVTREYTYPTIPPLTYSFQTYVNNSEVIPVGWKKLVHPEGACYYVYGEKKYWTDANIMDEMMRDRVMSCIHDFEDFIRSQSIQLSSDVNIVFDIQRNDEDLYCGYYIVDHCTRSVFWLDTFEAQWFPVWFEVEGVTSLAHIQHEIISQYWFHCSLYPHSLPLSLENVDELRDILLYNISDIMTSYTSTVPYPLSELKDMMLLANNIRKNPGALGGVSTFARLMYIFAEQRFLNFASTPSARLDRNRSIYHPPDQAETYPWLMRVLSPALFSAPNLYYRSINKIWVDNLLHEAAWADFINTMNEEWQQLILFNTVLLNANVAFLAIQSIDNASGSPGRSPAQIASFLSIVASFGSIILGLVLARKHRAKAKATATDAAQFLRSWMRHQLGIATLAVLYSVPYALLMWGVICFLVAFSFMCYSNSDILVRLIMSGAWLIVAILGFWCLAALASWDERLGNDKSFWEFVHGLLSYIILGPFMLVKAVIDMTNQCWRSIRSKSPRLQEPEQRSIELNARKSSMGTVVELWRKSSLFSRTDDNDKKERRATDDTVVEV